MRKQCQALLRLFTHCICLLLLLTVACQSPQATNDPQKAFQAIANDLNGVLGVSALHIETGATIAFNGNKRFPMQSVYKFPIAMAMLHEVDAGRFTLDQKVIVSPEEYIPKAGHSPLRDKNPNGATLTIKELLEYNTAISDGTACDVLLRLLGGTAQTEKRVHQTGIKNIAIATTEMVQVANDSIQYQNWTTPNAMSQLFKAFFTGTYLSPASKNLMLEHLSVNNKWFDRRIKALLPKGTKVFHKTGSARTYNGLTRATNDAGIIVLPDGSHLAVSVFVMDAYNTQEEREKTIAKAAKVAYDHWVKQN